MFVSFVQLTCGLEVLVQTDFTFPHWKISMLFFKIYVHNKKPKEGVSAILVYNTTIYNIMNDDHKMEYGTGIQTEWERIIQYNRSFWGWFISAHRR